MSLSPGQGPTRTVGCEDSSQSLNRKTRAATRWRRCPQAEVMGEKVAGLRGFFDHRIELG